MHLMPIDGSRAVALFLDYEGHWCVRYLDAGVGTTEGFKVPATGQIVDATVNPDKAGVLALMDNGDVVAFLREQMIAMKMPPPPAGLVPLSVGYIDRRYYLAGLNAHICYYDMGRMEWVTANAPPPRPRIPDRYDSEPIPDHADRVLREQMAYISDFPAVFGIFPVGTDHYFVGGGGHVMRLRDGRFDDLWLDSGYRLAHGHEEDGQAVIAASDARSEIYRGTIDGGFERIFDDPVSALHLNARHGGRRYIGAAMDETYEGPTLFTLEEGELVPVEMGPDPEDADRDLDPGILTTLVSTGGALWAADLAGVYRLADGKWRYWELNPTPV